MSVTQVNADAGEAMQSKYGCSIFATLFGRRRQGSKKSSSTGNPVTRDKGKNASSSRRRKGGADESGFLPQDNSPATPSESNALVQVQTPLNQISNTNNVDDNDQRAMVPRINPNTNANQLVPMTMSGELVAYFGGGVSPLVQNRSPTPSHGCNTLVRASSKVMVLGHLGNLRQSGSPLYDEFDDLPYHKNNVNNNNNIKNNQRGPNANPSAYAAASEAAEAAEAAMAPRRKYGQRSTATTTKSNDNNLTNMFTSNENGGGSVQPDKKKGDVKKNRKERGEWADGHDEGRGVTGLSRALSKREDPEELKEAGNEEYKSGRFTEALALYDRAILLAPQCASYHSNKSAALIGLGRFLEAVEECKEATKIDPTYVRAHHRLATVYFRLGVVDKALSHYKQAGTEPNATEIHQVQSLESRLAKCTKARKQKDYQTLLKEAASAIADGADAAPTLFAFQAEALMKLHKHEEADNVLSSCPPFEMDAAMEFFGAVNNAYLLLVRAQVDMSAGRFESAASASHLGSTLDSSNKEVIAVLRKARGVVAARSTGNELFKASKFQEASAAYSEGLELEPMNALLLCNRAACRSKLGELEKAIEDCNMSLKLRPSYNKARLRRADCNAKLGRWEASIKDYEVLMQELPNDSEIVQALKFAQLQLKKQPDEDLREEDIETDVTVVSSADEYKQLVRYPGICVVFFCSRSSEQSVEIMPFTEKLSKRHESIQFIKVDIEDSPALAKFECVSSVPTFKIYKNGSKVKDIAGANQQLLESSVKHFRT